MIDPRISLGVQPVQLNDPLDNYAKVASIKNVLARGRQDEQQAQINDENLKRLKMGNEAAQKAVDFEDSFQGIRREANGDLGKAISLAEQRGFPAAYTEKLKKDAAATVKELAESDNAKWKAFETHTDLIREHVGALAQEQDPAKQRAMVGSTLQQFRDAGVLTPQQVQQYAAQYEAQGPAAVREWASDSATVKSLKDAAAERRAAAEEARKVETHTLDVANKNADLSDQYMKEAGVFPESDAQSQTADYKNYLKDKAEGFKGNFDTWQTRDANRKRPTDNGVALQNQLDREANTFRTPHQKSLNDADTKLQTVADAKAMINGGAVGQALGLPKVLSAVVGGSGSGLRMTEPELKRIAGARGIKGDIEGFFNQLSGQGSFTTEQKRQATQILDDVAQRLREKRNIADDALNRINSAKSRDEIVKIDSDVRKKISDLENGAPSGQSRIRILKVE